MLQYILKFILIETLRALLYLVSFMQIAEVNAKIRCCSHLKRIEILTEKERVHDYLANKWRNFYVDNNRDAKSWFRAMTSRTGKTQV